MIQSLLLVALGGRRFRRRFLLVAGAVRLVAGWPAGTLLVNVIGSFAIGVLYVTLAQRAQVAPLLVAGFLGGFTTFSAFSLDTLKLWEGGRPAAGRRLCRGVGHPFTCCRGAWRGPCPEYSPHDAASRP